MNLNIYRGQGAIPLVVAKAGYLGRIAIVVLPISLVVDVISFVFLTLFSVSELNKG